MVFAYAFEARSIQAWLLAGGRLADMVAASDLIDRLCGDLFDAVLEGLELEEDRDVRLARRAGATVYAVAARRAPLEALRDLMSLVVPAYAPGLEFIQALGEGESEAQALKATLARLQLARNRPPVSLPQAGPLVEREARTGEAAVAFVRAGPARKRGAIGAATRVKRAADAVDALSARFIPRDEQGAANWVWPTNMEPEDEADGADSRSFPFSGESQLIGVIHADGNGLGQILLQLQEAVAAAPGIDYVGVFRDFSDRVERATLEAAGAATREVLLPAAVKTVERGGQVVMRLPARPLVLGGDDLSIIVRADLALACTRRFLAEFDIATARQLAAWRADPRWAALFDSAAGRALAALDRMTACAGIAIVRASHPFELAYELAESLCKRAKAASGAVQPANGPKPASLAFYRLTTALGAADDPVRITLPDRQGGKAQVALRLPAWAVERDKGLVTLDALQAMADLLGGCAELAPGALRHLLNVMQEDSAAAPELYRRWRQVRPAEALQDFDDALAALGIAVPEFDLPVLALDCAQADQKLYCPLEDVFDLLAVAQEEDE